MNIPWVESPFFTNLLKEKTLTEEQQKLATEYHENGFVVLKNLVDDTTIQQVRKDMDEKGYNESFNIKTHRDKVRIQDFWQYSESCKTIACNKKVLEILNLLYDREPIPFQTLNFRVGTQQRAHSDTIHFSSIPARFMCGVWVALEDTTPENGAVFYYPKSQNLPEYNFAHFRAAPEDTSYKDYIAYEDFIEKVLQSNQYECKPFYAKKGDVLIWSSNIIHGGSKVTKEDSTRYSQVTHYFFKDCIYYTPMLSNMVTNELFIRNELVDIKTGKKIEQSFNGHKVSVVKTANDKFLLSNRLKEKKLFKVSYLFKKK
jgi:ectoine hydroxylase-related dioxygenase (phytanoyl-CoA dioxygenase family)